MARIKCKYNYQNTRHQVYYDSTTYEIVQVMAPVWYKNDFQNPAQDETNDVATGEETGSVAIAVATNGWTRLSTSTTPDQRQCISGELVWEAENELIWQCKLKTTSSDAALFLNVGVTDSKDEGSGTLPFVDGSMASGVIDSVADDAVMFAVRAETSDNIYAVSVAANGTPQSTDTGIDLVLGTDYIFEIVLDADGVARYSINGALVAVHTSAVTVTDPLTWYAGATITAGSTEALVDIDYVLMAQRRS